jgi:hypothetical protein
MLPLGSAVTWPRKERTSSRLRPVEASAAGLSLDPHGRFFRAVDGDLADPFDLAEFLADDLVGVFVNLCVGGSVSEVIARIHIGASAGLTLR